jgi:hypothetical protein
MSRGPLRHLSWRLSRRAVVGLATGVAMVGTAWAGVGLAPVVRDVATPPTADTDRSVAEEASAAGLADLPVVDVVEIPARSSAAEPPDLSGLTRLPAGQFLVGADTSSLAPDPERWQTEGCSTYASNFPEEVGHLAHRITEDMVLPGWPRSPDCVYLGGYGLGPARAATGIDPVSGYDVQTVAISNGEDLVIWQQTPFVGFFSTYRADLCTGCGILDIRRAVADGLDTELSNVAIASNHSHGGADGYGAWGGLPTWYREQVRDVLINSAYDAAAAMRPAVLEVGEVDGRPFSNERRSTYHSVADFGAVWLQARELPTAPTKGKPRSVEPRVIATVVNFAAHPTVLGADNLLLHGDWPYTAGQALGDSLGGVGIVFEGGLGNVTPGRPTRPDGDLTGDGVVDRYDEVLQMGRDFASVVGADIARGGHRMAGNDIASVDADVVHPVTNWTETALSLVNLLDRDFFGGDGGEPGGSYVGYREDEGTGPARPCVSASPVSIRTTQTAMRIGDLTILTAPGEIFSGVSLVAKSKVRPRSFEGGQTMVFGQAQDSLGYIIQSYELYPPGGVSAGTGGIEYEETFLLDRCFGDHVLEVMLELGREVWVP